MAGDTNELSDIFVHDTQTGTTERVSVDTDGAEFNQSSFNPSISDDGRFVAMQSYRGTAFGGVQYAKIIVCDRQTNTSTLILPHFGSQPPDKSARLKPVISGDGRFVAFHSFVSRFSAQLPIIVPPDDDTNRAHDIFVYDLQDDFTERVSRDSNGVGGNGDSFSASLSDDGNFVAFYSYANNLVANDTNDVEDVFVKNRSTGVSTRVSVASDGAQGNGDSHDPIISGNGRFIVFRSLASNLVGGDANGSWDIFVHDRNTDGNGVFDEPGKILTERVSVASDGTEANDHSYSPSISDDGR